MRKNLWQNNVLLCFALFQCTLSGAQSSFEYTSSLSEVKSGGFYKIILLPSIISKCKNEFNDIRILDNKGRQVPYVLKSDQPVFRQQNFIELPMLSIKKEADKQTHIVFENKLQKTISELLLVIKNTDADRMVSISGSDDQKQWFVISEGISLTSILVNDKDRFFQSLSFPKSTYKFFEIVINGKDLLPFNIVKVGVYEGLLRNGEYVPVPDPTFVQKDSSNKSSYVSVYFNDKYLVNKIQLEVQGPKFFRRRLTISEDDGNNILSIGGYILSSGIDNGYTLNIKTKKLLFVIENEDSPPVILKSVKAYQLNKYLLTYLEPSNEYQLQFGDSAVAAPRYDLEFFKDSLKNSPAEISTGAIVRNKFEKNITNTTGSKNMLFLWVIIGAVLIVLLLLTLRMTKEIAAKNNEEQK